MIRRQFIHLNGMRIHYLVAGQGPPVLLLHGLAGSALFWKNNIGPLSQEYRVYAIDFPGHGLSDRPFLDYSLEGMVNLMKAFLDALSLERVAVIGNSAGGLVAIKMATALPRRVSKLVLVGSVGLGQSISWMLRLLSLPLIGEAFLLIPPPMWTVRLALRGFFSDPQFISDGLGREAGRMWKDYRARAAMLKFLRRSLTPRGLRREFVLRDTLKTIHIPILGVWGSEDRIVPVKNALEAASSVPNLRLRVLERCGHLPHMEKSGEFNEVVLEFLRE